MEKMVTFFFKYNAAPVVTEGSYPHQVVVEVGHHILGGDRQGWVYVDGGGGALWRAADGAGDHLQGPWVDVGARSFGGNVKERGAGVCNCFVRLQNVWRRGSRRRRWYYVGWYYVWWWGGSTAGTRI